MSTQIAPGFTPGPWVLLPEHLRRYEVERLRTEDTTNVCTVSQQGNDTVYHAVAAECSIADANLIAAAPMLYAALQRLLMAYGLDAECMPSQAVALSWQTNSQAIQAARAALALADGKETT